MAIPRNLNNWKPSQGMGKNVKSTSQLSGEAKVTSDWKSKNETVEHTTGAQSGKDNLGGKNTFGG